MDRSFVLSHVAYLAGYLCARRLLVTSMSGLTTRLKMKRAYINWKWLSTKMNTPADLMNENWLHTQERTICSVKERLLEFYSDKTTTCSSIGDIQIIVLVSFCMVFDLVLCEFLSGDFTLSVVCFPSSREAASSTLQTPLTAILPHACFRCHPIMLQDIRLFYHAPVRNICTTFPCHNPSITTS